MHWENQKWKRCMNEHWTKIQHSHLIQSLADGILCQRLGWSSSSTLKSKVFDSQRCLVHCSWRVIRCHSPLINGHHHLFAGHCSNWSDTGSGKLFNLTTCTKVILHCERSHCVGRFQIYSGASGLLWWHVNHYQILNLGGGFKHCLFSQLVKWWNSTNIFQMAWNHHLVNTLLPLFWFYLLDSYVLSASLQVVNIQ